jgi:hypothetical protein
MVLSESWSCDSTDVLHFQATFHTPISFNKHLLLTYNFRLLVVVLRFLMTLLLTKHLNQGLFQQILFRGCVNNVLSYGTVERSFLLVLLILLISILFLSWGRKYKVHSFLATKFTTVNSLSYHRESFLLFIRISLN